MDDDMKDAGAGKAIEAASKKLDQEMPRHDTGMDDGGGDRNAAPRSVEDAIEMAMSPEPADDAETAIEELKRADDPTPV